MSISIVLIVDLFFITIGAYGCLAGCEKFKERAMSVVFLAAGCADLGKNFL